MTLAHVGPIVSADWLAAHASEVRIADARWYLPGTGRTGRAEYAAAHLPGAVFLDIDEELADPPTHADGRHPLPSVARFEGAMARAGISDDTNVVAVDDVGGAMAARLWWLLRYFGHRGRAFVLDGGIAAWQAAGGASTRQVPTPARGSFHARPRPELVVSRQDVERMARDAGVVMLDARAPERWAGVSEPIDARPGRIPGAKNAPFADNVADGKLRGADELRARYAALGVGADTTVVAYCGSGVTACHDILALEIAGLPGALLYAGSYSQWAAEPSLPVETGA